MWRNRSVFLLLLLAACLAVAGSASAQRDRDRGRDRDWNRDQWELLGDKRVGLGVDRDVINVGRREGRFEKIRLEVLDNDVFLLDLKIVYGNGDVQDFPVGALIRRGSGTRPIDLTGGDRFIDRIEMTYRSRPNSRGQALVQVYGEKGGGRPGGDAWVELGCQRVGFIADRDIIRVGREDGRFSAIQLRVFDNAINMLDLKVVYANGQPDDIPVRAELRPGQPTRPLDLRGERRAIRQIEMTYSSKLNFRGQARICAYGRA